MAKLPRMNFDKLIFILIFLCSAIHIQCQDESEEKNWSLSGYHKSLQGLFHISEPSFGLDTVLSDAFLHTRLNFEWFPSEKWIVKAELRSRFFFGELTRSAFFPTFKESLKEDGNDVLNLQILNVGNKVVLHSIFDRLYAEYTSGDWEFRFGRQRINWGINTVWNPHDIFNAYTFTDFDYEERPGSDAIRIKKYTGFASSIELAFKAFDSSDEIVGGVLWKLNKSNYDYQFLIGWAFEDLVLGAGWSGELGDIGFKGEMSFFKSTNSNISDAFAGTLSLDYAFKNSAFLNIGMLFNSTDNERTNLFAFDLNARNLYPYRWATFYSLSYPFSPIVTGSMAIIYSPVSGHPLFLNPSFSYNIAQNVDVSFVGQILFEGQTGPYRSPTKVAYLRVKWSF